MKFPAGVLLGCILLLAFSLGDVAAQEKPAVAASVENATFDEQSLALRTALHYDPSLEVPVKSLVALYQKADRIEELIGLYRGHIAQYPDDPGAKTVMIRILQKLNRTEADEMIQAAAQQHPENPLVQFLLYEYRERRQDERALESLSRAIELETKPGRRDAWLEILLEESGEGVDRALAETHLKRIRIAEGHTVETLLSLAERMHRFGFHELAMATLADAAKKTPSPEANVEIEVLSAKAQAALGDQTGAGSRLEALIARLAPDYWRRAEIMSLRINLLSSDAERNRLLTEAKIRFEADPDNESAVLEYAELLYASEERAEAVKVLNGAAAVLPNSQRIEAEALKILERLGDDEKLWDFLNARLELFPERADLRFRLVKSAYLLGKTEQAKEDLEMVLAQLEGAEERERNLLDLARFLRRVSLTKEAAKLFDRVLAENPGRFDVRRELSETHLANEDRLSAMLVLRDLPIKDAAIENFTDLIEFMMQNEFLLEALKALESRLEMEPDNFELRLYLVDVLGKAGERNRAETLLLDARELADTPARYSRWLETGLAVHELFDSAEQFFDNEHVRFIAGNGGDEIKWTAEQIEKFLTFFELGKRGNLDGQVTQALRNQLAGSALPSDLRIKLRNLLVKALEKSQDNAAEVEQQLKLLAEEDKVRADEYGLRRALLYHTMQRPDLAQESMASVKIENIRDAGVLRAAAQVLVEYGMFDKARACLEGVTTQDPTDLNNWERRMTLLAAMGREDELRKALRHLLAGVNQINLNPDSLSALQLHLLDSYWRTIARLLADETAESMAEIFPFLDAVERETIKPQDRLWSLWVRAYVLNAQGRKAGRDAAIEQLKLLAGTSNAAESDPAIAFPDGLTVTVEAAIELLREPPGARVAEAMEDVQDGPLGTLAMGWAFESDPGSKILQFEPIPEGLLVLDDKGTVYRIDTASGKLLWRERFGLPEEPGNSKTLSAGGAAVSGGGLTISNRFYQVRQQGASIRVQQLVAPYGSTSIGPGASAPGTTPANAAPDVSGVKLARRFATDGERFYLPFEDEIQARSADDGRLVWAASLSPSMLNPDLRNSELSSRTQPEMHLSAEGGQVFAFLPQAGTAACFDAVGGKLIWMREIAASEESAGAVGGGSGLFSLNSGAAFSPGRMLVFGDRSLILDAATGEVIWSFESGGVRAFPVDLAQTDAEQTKTKTESSETSVAAPLTTALPKPGFLDHLSLAGESAEALKSFLQYRGALVAPAVHWAGTRLTEGSAATAVVESGRMLLMDASGVREISLRLPLASRHFDVQGVFLGMAGTRAWFLDGVGLIRIDLDEGEVFRIPVNGVAGNSGVRAILSGSRVYVTGERGIVVLNAHSGGRINETDWPVEFVSYRDKAVEETAPLGEAPQFLWQGISRQIPGLPSKPATLTRAC